MREIVPGVFTWPWFSEPHGYSFNGYFVADPDMSVCIDPVEPSDQVLQELEQRGVGRILITNRNHVRAANRLRQATSARVAIHPADAEYARGQGAIIDDELRTGEKIGPLVIVDASGKSPGEVALHWPARRLLIVGDVVIGNPPGSCGLLKERVMDDPARLRASVRRLLGLDFDTLLVGDGEPILTGAKRKLEDLVGTVAAQ